MIDSRSFIQLPTTPLPALGAFVSSQRLPTCHQQNEIEEDAASGSSISRASSMDYTDDEEEVSSIMETEDDNDEDDPSDYSDSDMDVKDVTLEVSVPDERVLAHRASMKKFKDMRPALQDWIDSWSEKKIPDVGWLNVYGYCNKDKGYGGYGVVLRDNWARPITAATCLHTRRGSQFFQVLSGLKTGLGLAIKYGCLRLIVGCNVRKAVDLLDFVFQKGGACRSGAGSSSHVKIKGICKDCSKRRVLVKDTTLETSIPVIANLKDLRAQLDKSQFVGFSMIDRDENEPAHCLAKMAKRDALKAKRLPLKESKVIRPADFPHKLEKTLGMMLLTVTPDILTNSGY
ncbi:hypothetical protein MKW92_049151 [Papaver armeniacum]|nr:hypothetical protein MKW92_049151 [Papaver armeniacum]